MLTPSRVQAASGRSCWERYCPEAPKTCVSSGVWMIHPGLSRMIAGAKDGIRPRSSLRRVGPEVSQSTFARIRRPVINDVTVGIFEKFASLPSRGNFPGGALQTFHPGGYDVPAEFGGVLSGGCIKNHQLDALTLSFPDVLYPKGDHASQLEAEISVGDGLGFVVPDFRMVVT